MKKMTEKVIRKIISKINQEAQQNEIKIMEVCGTHTHAIAKYGIRALIHSKIRLLSGPGCPVCVTPESVIDGAIHILEDENVIIVTFGDLASVKGTTENLLDQRAKGRQVSIIYSPFDLLEVAEKNKHKQVVFLAVGFETTAPVFASVIKLAKEKNLGNLCFLISLRRMPPVLHEVMKQDPGQLHGMICPGHVAAVMGAEYFQFIGKEYNLPAVITGFEALDIVSAILWVVQTHNTGGMGKFANLYKESVQCTGNKRAKEVIDEVFDISDGNWRGIGNLQNSAYILKKSYSQFDASVRFDIKLDQHMETTLCVCKEILMGKKAPDQCEKFSTTCHPGNPQGPCMISNEGPCSAYYHYKGR